MKKYMEKLANLTIKKSNNKYQAGFYEGIVSCIVNFIIFIIKIIIGLSIQSIALLTDAFHSLSDSLSSVVIIVGFHYSSKPPDKKHPFGHAKSENIAALIVSIMLFIISFEFLKDSFIRIIHPQKVHFSFICLLILVVTIIIKEALSQYSIFLGKKLDSVALEADAFHHKTDVYATILVIVSIVLSSFNLHRIDGIMGMIISCYIAYIAYDMARKSVNPLIGEKPPESLIEEIKKTVLAFKHIEGIHDIIIHDYGDKYIISFHIEVPDSFTPHEIHDIADEVEKKIGKLFNATCVVHQDPINKNHPCYERIKKILDSLIKDKLYHDIKIVGGEKKFNVIFDINFNANKKELEKIKTTLKENIAEIDSVIIKIEPSFVYS